jgi:hypothetical protein
VTPDQLTTVKAALTYAKHQRLLLAIAQHRANAALAEADQRIHELETALREHEGNPHP